MDHLPILIAAYGVARLLIAALDARATGLPLVAIWFVALGGVGLLVGGAIETLMLRAILGAP